VIPNDDIQIEVWVHKNQTVSVYVH